MFIAAISAQTGGKGLAMSMLHYLHGSSWGRETWLERQWRRIRLGAKLALAGIAVALAVGFGVFVATLPAMEPSALPRADAIVVLTGGADRVADAVQLMAQGRGARLLISGVHPTTTRQEIARQIPDMNRLAGCCVDLDYAARNTFGNAVETARWAEGRGFRSVIVVTSNYHMPRALLEMSRTMPEVSLVPYPVVSGRMQGDAWWQDIETARIVLGEYVKYVAALAHIRFEPADPPGEVATARQRPAG
jgi:uncharacterized SAM-binding protein YcdF (DUF218 family)